MTRVLLSLVLVVFSWFNVASAEVLGPDINVALVVNQFSAEITSEAEFKVLVKPVGNNLLFQPKKTFISVKNGIFLLDGKSIEGTEVELLSSKADKPVLINRKSYRGRLVAKINEDKKTLTICNILPLEEYLYGVVAREIIPLWPEEAIKVQAVASRSFALAAIKKQNSRGYDIRANELGQVYGGIEAEHIATNKMIDATRGVVLTYNGKPIEACYHSSSGGYTENSENVWGTYVPYLRAVVDYDQEAPKYKWEKSFTASEIENILLQAGYRIGKLKSIKLSPLKPPAEETADRGISGRGLKMTFTGDNGEATLDGAKVRGILQLNSTLFDIFIETKSPEYIEVPVLDAYGNEIGKKQIPVKITQPSKPSYLNGFEDLRLITGDVNEKIVIKGQGWGHGLGLSQWGARGMALAAPQNSKEYYKKILTHYYTNVKIEKIY